MGEQNGLLNRQLDVFNVDSLKEIADMFSILADNNEEILKLNYSSASEWFTKEEICSGDEERLNDLCRCNIVAESEDGLYQLNPAQLKVFNAVIQILSTNAY